MYKPKLKILSLILAASSFQCAPAVSMDEPDQKKTYLTRIITKNILDHVSEKLSKAPEKEKEDILANPMDGMYLRALQDGKQPLDFEKLFTPNKDKMHNTNALAFAILAGEYEYLGQFLSAVEKPNDPRFYTWGYRQPYSLVHVAMDPTFPCKFNNVPLNHRKEILMLVCQHKCDFNFVPDTSYFSKAIHVGGMHQYNTAHFRDIELPKLQEFVQDMQAIALDVQASALPYNVDPFVEGSTKGAMSSSASGRSIQ